MHKCVICDEVKEAGIHLHMIFICTSCEDNMIHTDVREEKYRYYISKLKNTSAQASNL